MNINTNIKLVEDLSKMDSSSMQDELSILLLSNDLDFLRALRTEAEQLSLVNVVDEISLLVYNTLHQY